MINNDNGQLLLLNKKNLSLIKNMNLPKSNFLQQSRNYNNDDFLKERNNGKYSHYSTKEGTPRKEGNKLAIPPTLKKGIRKATLVNQGKNLQNELDDSLSQISVLLNNKKHFMYSNLADKFVNEEPNFVYDQMVFNKSRINKAKILYQKIGVLKLPISKISTKEALTNSDRGEKCFSDRIQVNGNMNKNEESSNDDTKGISCCFFSRK